MRIPAGATTANVPVTVLGDARNEGLIESLTVTLSAPSGATLADSKATLTLVDEEGPIFAYPSDTRVVEGNTGTRSMVFTLSLAAAPATGQTVNVRYAASNGTATTAGFSLGAPLAGAMADSVAPWTAFVLVATVSGVLSLVGLGVLRRHRGRVAAGAAAGTAVSAPVR